MIITKITIFYEVFNILEYEKMIKIPKLWKNDKNPKIMQKPPNYDEKTQKMIKKPEKMIKIPKLWKN